MQKIEREEGEGHGLAVREERASRSEKRCCSDQIKAGASDQITWC